MLATTTRGGHRHSLFRGISLVSPNKSLQGSGTDKVLGRGRSGGVLKQVVRARVLKGTRPAPELSR